MIYNDNLRIGVVGCHPLVGRAVAAEIVGQRIDRGQPPLGKHRVGLVAGGHVLQPRSHLLTSSAACEQGKEHDGNDDGCLSMSFHVAKIVKNLDFPMELVKNLSYLTMKMVYL